MDGRREPGFFVNWVMGDAPSADLPGASAGMMDGFT